MAGTKTVFLHGRPFVVINQINAAQAHIGARFGQIVEADFLVTPACHGLFQSSGVPGGFA